MRNAERFLSILRERGSRRQPVERLYRQLFNPDFLLHAYGRLYRNAGAMTAGSTDETVDGMTFGSNDIDGLQFAERKFLKPTAKHDRWEFQHGATNSCRKPCEYYWRLTTNQNLVIFLTASGPIAVATRLSDRSIATGEARFGSSKETSEGALTTSTIRYC